MKGLFIFFLIVDVLIAFFLFRMAFIEHSNMNRKYRRRLGLLTLFIVAAIALRPINLTTACMLAGLPAGLLILFGLIMVISMATHKGPWH